MSCGRSTAIANRKATHYTYRMIKRFFKTGTKAEIQMIFLFDGKHAELIENNDYH